MTSETKSTPLSSPLVEKKENPLTIPNSILMELIRAVHEKGASFRFMATGGSMTPSIRNNDFLTISPLEGMPPFPGEVVAFRHPRSDRLTLHRVYEVKKNTFSIKADNQNVVDAVISIDDILGVVTRVERGEKVKFWPDRFNHPVRTRFYSKIYLRITRIRRLFRILLRPIKKRIKQIIS